MCRYFPWDGVACPFFLFPQEEVESVSLRRCVCVILGREGRYMSEGILEKGTVCARVCVCIRGILTMWMGRSAAFGIQRGGTTPWPTKKEGGVGKHVHCQS